MNVIEGGVLLSASVIAFTATAAFAADGFTPERRALFVSIIEENGCKMNNLAPQQSIIDALQSNEFTRDEIRAIGQDVLATGDAAREGEVMVMKTEKCS